MQCYGAVVASYELLTTHFDGITTRLDKLRTLSPNELALSLLSVTAAVTVVSASSCQDNNIHAVRE